MNWKVHKPALCFLLMLAVATGAGGCGRSGRAVRESMGRECAVRITGLTVNYDENPIGIERTPLFGWRMESDAEGQLQTAYRIVVAESGEELENEKYVWDSGRTDSGISVAVPYGGAELMPETAYVWKVYVWDRDGNLSESSGEAVFETGLTGGDWGGGEETYTLGLVCRGFRYVQISGTDEQVPPGDISGLVITTDNRRTGTFSCSDERVNRLYDSICWTQVSNYLDVPTDCPQRDERFGWAGDAQVFANTAAYNADVHNYLKKYVEMLISCQDERGAFPDIAPSAGVGNGANGWSDAGIILVWELYQQYGDRQIIRDHLDAMCRYVDFLVDTSDGFIRTQHGYSDHNAVSALDHDIANTAQCAYVARLLSKMSAEIGENDIAKKYDMVYNQYKKAWQEHYINEDGTIGCWLQSAYTLGLAYDLYPEGLEAQGAACLNSAVAASDGHLNTGYIATQFLLPVLCRYGYVDTAYRILQQDTYPSWNDMLSNDQTTLTEAWFTCRDTGDGTYTVDGSMNHPGLGSVGQWLYSDVLGIKRDEDSPGFRHFYIEPLPGGGMTYASGSYESPYGTIESSWAVEEDGGLTFDFTIPANTTATVSLPDARYRNMELGAGRHEYHIVPAASSPDR